jgi:hypothetical protein
MSTYTRRDSGLFVPLKSVQQANFEITLEYEGKTYVIIDTFEAWDEYRDACHVAEYMYTEGNYGCDCNRSQFIGKQCDENFPELPCGREINLVSIKMVEDQG